MANLNETDQWEAGIYQLEEDDPVLGGPTGIDNLAPRQLANRARYQRLRNVTPWDATLTYPANVAYVSYGGTTWKSVGESLNVVPGEDAAKWVRWGFTAAELDAALGDSVAAHEAKANPHPQYATDADLAAHVAAANPHPGYATDADLAAHVAATDPHPQYASDTDLANHAAAANPHPQYATDADLAAHVNAGDPHPQYASDTDLANHAAAANPHPVYARLAQLNPPIVATHFIAGANQTVHAEVVFTVPGPGRLIAFGIRNNSQQAAGTNACTLYINGVAMQTDNTITTMAHMATMAVQGGAVSAGYTVAAQVAFSACVMLMFIPNI